MEARLQRFKSNFYLGLTLHDLLTKKKIGKTCLAIIALQTRYRVYISKQAM